MLSLRFLTGPPPCGACTDDRTTHCILAASLSQAPRSAFGANEFHRCAREGGLGAPLDSTCGVCLMSCCICEVRSRERLVKASASSCCRTSRTIFTKLNCLTPGFASGEGATITND